MPSAYSLTIRPFRIDFHTRGKCWRIFQLPRYRKWGGGTRTLGWWRLSLVWDPV